MARKISFIGFGEAAQAFACAGIACAYDLKTRSPSTRDAKLADYARAAVLGCTSASDAVAGADAVLSLVTADQALAVARDCAKMLSPGAIWFDMNSVAPGTKRAAALEIETAGGRYVDVAILAPVYPQRRGVPLFLSGPHADAGVATLTALGFTNLSTVLGDIGAASAIKMIRSVLVKGLEALTTECVLAAEAAGVCAEVIASLNASWPGTDWAEKAAYNLDRMIVHGHRRAAEMEEVVVTLDELGTGSAMTRATVEQQRAIGDLKLAPLAGLAEQISAVMKARSSSGAHCGVRTVRDPALAAVTE